MVSLLGTTPEANYNKMYFFIDDFSDKEYSLKQWKGSFYVKSFGSKLMVADGQKAVTGDFSTTRDATSELWLLIKGLDVENVMLRWWNGSLYIDDPLAKIAENFDTKKATIISKSTYDVFNGTNLLNILRNSGYTQIVITGVATHLCCETTARSAFCHNFDVFLPIDCLATYTEELHINSLKAAAHGFGIPTTSQEILEMMTIE